MKFHKLRGTLMIHSIRKLLQGWEEFGKDFKVPLRKIYHHTNFLWLVYSRRKTESKTLPLYRTYGSEPSHTLSVASEISRNISQTLSLTLNVLKFLFVDFKIKQKNLINSWALWTESRFIMGNYIILWAEIAS